jgi:ketosteroid isomerase-like protein
LSYDGRRRTLRQPDLQDDENEECMENFHNDKRTVTRAVYCVFFCACMVIGCNSAPQQPAAPPDTRAADEAAVRKADEDWSAVAKTNQADAWVAFYSDDAVIFPPNGEMTSGKENIHKAIGEFLSMPGLSLSWKTTKVATARSGELAYSYGAYEMSAKGPKGKPITDHGKYLEVWKKQADGSWKCSEDIWNSDVPAAPPAK